jgi:DNA-binding response OmpR family regulator
VESVRLVGVDDALRTFLRYLLLLDGYRVITARNGRDVLDAVDHEEVDVILTHLPGPAGDEQPWVRTLHRHRGTEESGPIAMALSLFG